jgi:SNF2 family DNA or RNA helicase
MDLSFKNVDVFSKNGCLFKSILLKEKDKILNYYENTIDKLEPYKNFCSNFIQTNSNFKKILLYHGTGSGKTLTGIKIINNISIFARNLYIIIICPAVLQKMWKNELKVFLKTKSLLNRIIFISLDSPNFIQEFDIEYRKISLSNTNILLMDEAHLFFSSLNIETDSKRLIVYNQILDLSIKNIYILLLTATPIVNRIQEIMYMFNILRPGVFVNNETKFEEVFTTFRNSRNINTNINNHEFFLKRITGLISYFEKTEGLNYPKVTDKIINIEMSDIQEESYNIIENEERMKGGSSFLQKSLAACNFIVPKDLLSLYTIGELNIRNYISSIDKDLADKLSPKTKFIGETLKNTSRPCLYSTTNIETSLMPTEYILEYHYGFKSFNDPTRENYKCFASIYGKIKSEDIDLIRETFNSRENQDGKLIKLLIITKKFGVGITLKNIEVLFIDSFRWNSASLIQIKGRSVRFNTHIDLPEEKKFINIYTLVSIRKIRPDLLTANEKLKNITFKKDKINNEFLELMKIGSIDIDLNINDSTFKYNNLVPWNPNYNYILNQEPFITKNSLEDYDLKLDLNILEVQNIKLKRINVLIDDKKLIVFLYVVKTYYLIFDEIYKTIIGELVLDEFMYPIIKNSYFIGKLYI